MQDSAPWASRSARQPKDCHRFVRCRHRHQPPDRTPDHHYYRPLPLKSISDRSRNCRGFDTVCLLLRLIVVRAINDDYLTVTKRPEDVAVEVVEKLFGKFLIVRSVNNERRRAAH
jgi:hypothetical protein